MKINLVSFDPSLSNWGTARAQYDTETEWLTFSSISLFETEAEKSKTIRKNCDDLDRSRILYGAMILGCTGASFAIAEAPIGSQSASAMKGYGVCIGVLGACPIPLILVTPNEVKRITGQEGEGLIGKDVSKAQMIAWGMRMQPDLNWLRETRKGKKHGTPLNKNEHMADAIAAMYAGVKTQQFKEIVALSAAFRP